MKTPIYMDYNSTTPIDPRVYEAMQPYFTDKYGNAASRSHKFGWVAEEAVEHAREKIAKLINASPAEIIFTSGATESDNLALKGVAHMYGMAEADKFLIDTLAKGHASGSISDAENKLPARFGRLDLEEIAKVGAFEYFKEKGDHIITLVTEHKAILDSTKRLEKDGWKITYLQVQKDGLVSLDALKKAITKDTILVSIMLGNNEIGVVQPVAEIGAICRKHKVLFHTDAVQAVGKIPVDVELMNIDLLSLTAHKMYGPKGVGALYVRRRRPRVRLEAGIDGGGHERGMRSGTLNVAGIVGFGKAAEICLDELSAEQEKVQGLRDRLWKKFQDNLDEVYLNGHDQCRLPNNLNVSFAYVEGEALMMAIKDVAVSSGSACTSASLEPSYVLRALGVGDELAHSSIRFGVGRFTTEEEIDFVADLVIAAVRRLRDMSPLYEMVKEGVDLESIEWAAH
ncbi:MAG: aminotransferase class V-fold PLP-dependent enzyme [Myxococcales bacterium]|nr:aminotransferase class V-fold PLP-dependent enzyme [Myxococcales bacterium]